MKPDIEDIFSNASAYESYVGRWSRLVAPLFLAWLNVPPGRTWLDVGAGTGVLTEAILQQASPAKIVAVDLAQAYLDAARQRIHDERVEFRVADAAALTVAPPPFDAVVAGLVLNFLPEPGQAVIGMARAVRAGGTVAAYVWDYGGRMEMMRRFWDAAAVVPAARAMDAGQRFAFANADGLRALFEAAALKAVETAPLDIQTRFEDFDDYWLPFLGAQGSVSTFLRGLDDETRAALRDRLQRDLPREADGAILLAARAWAVKGTR